MGYPALQFWYRNHRGEISKRSVTKPEQIWFGSTKWHPEPQWLMTAWDIEKDALRDFAFKDILSEDDANVALHKAEQRE